MFPAWSAGSERAAGFRGQMDRQIGGSGGIGLDQMVVKVGAGQKAVAYMAVGAAPAWSKEPT